MVKRSATKSLKTHNSVRNNGAVPVWQHFAQVHVKDFKMTIVTVLMALVFLLVGQSVVVSIECLWAVNVHQHTTLFDQLDPPFHTRCVLSLACIEL